MYFILNNNMWLMIIFWIVLVTSVILILVNRRKYENLMIFSILVMTVIFVLALTTGDPLIFQEGYKATLELLVEGISLAGLSWLYYFNPMKKRIGDLEIGQGVIKTDIRNIKENVRDIKTDVSKIIDRIINGKIKK